MKAIRVHQFGGPEVLKLEEVPEAAGGAGASSGAGPCGGNQSRGYLHPLRHLCGQADAPYTPGKDAAGVVEAVGGGRARSEGRATGFMWGTASPEPMRNMLFASRRRFIRLPENVSFSQGAAVNVPYATAYRALFQRAKGVAGETGSGAWRDRRRGHCLGAIGAGGRFHRHRHRRHGGQGGAWSRSRARIMWWIIARRII